MTGGDNQVASFISLMNLASSSQFISSPIDLDFSREY
jgi:hypothetical protein